MRFIAVIPARYASTRFPGKPLAMLGGKTVIQRVYEQVATVLPDVYVATDDERIRQAVETFGGRAIMTRTDHKSGTDRIEEAVEKINADADNLVIINVQGDEPFVQPSQIETLCRLFDDPETQIGTLGKPFESIEAVENPNSPKIVTDNRGFALYFSRSVIPFVRGKERGEWLDHFPFVKHLGLYAYRRDVLREVTQLPQSSLELAESLEQLRWLQNGYRIRVGTTDVETVGIDTPQDLERAEQFLKEISLHRATESQTVPSGTTEPKAALFDLDGVVFDTEPQYTVFWGGECRRYHPEQPGLEHVIKGSTLDQIFGQWFADLSAEERMALVSRLDDYEANMNYLYVAGFEDFVKELRKQGFKTAVVTSSNHPKMESVYRKHPEFQQLFDTILTSEDFEYSKPHPNCYLKAAARLGVEANRCVVFEDSFNGLKSGRAAGMYVVGVATTNTAESIANLSDIQISDYRNFSISEKLFR